MRAWLFALVGPGVLLVIWGTLRFLPFPSSILEQDYSTVYLDRQGHVLHISLSVSGNYRIRSPLSEVPVFLRDGILSYEDRYFYFHPGVNLFSSLRALSQNLRNQRVISGASTLTMQLARLVENRPRTLQAKIFECFRALQFEVRYSKKEILEMYLNTIPMGGNLQGIGAAAWFYFGKSPSELSQTESLALIGIPKSPHLNRLNQVGAARRSAEKVAQRIHSKSLSDYSGHLADQYPKKPNPLIAPHLIQFQPRPPKGFFAMYHMDSHVQFQVERILKDAHQKNQREGIWNGAVVVMETSSRKVLAYVGSPDYEDETHGGKINGASILRSPGSTLKPFLYARCMEMGAATPATALMDVPRNYDSYFPKNFSGKEKGLVSLREALLDSLNIPAVRLERDLGRPLGNLLSKAFPVYKETRFEKAGLSVALGGSVMSLLELTGMYAALLGGGKIADPVFFQDEKGSPPTDFLDPRATWLVCDILSDYFRPDMPYVWDYTKSLARVALKTGTSFGLRDAWCLGGNGAFTIGVWVGNVRSQDSGTLIGAKKAAPVFIEIFNALTGNRDEWVPRPPKIGCRRVCVVSGMPAHDHCPRTSEDFFLEGVSAHQTCSVHRFLSQRVRDKKMICERCRDSKDGETTNRVFTIFNPEMTAFLRKTGRDFEVVPPHNPGCEIFGTGSGVRITSPEANAQFEIRENAPTWEQQLLLTADTAPESTMVYWFIGNNYLGEVAPGKRLLFKPERGQCKIRAVDTEGRGDEVEICVK